ncbi:ZN283 protein, partial [Formicarius rufipectus]|nr:ZN283 protein [Formicarius rufipectus]
CQERGQHFNQSSELMVQEQLPTREKPYKCLECGRSFSKTFHLSRHQKLHRGEQP